MKNPHYQQIVKQRVRRWQRFWRDSEGKSFSCHQVLTPTTQWADFMFAIPRQRCCCLVIARTAAMAYHEACDSIAHAEMGDFEEGDDDDWSFDNLIPIKATVGQSRKKTTFYQFPDRPNDDARREWGVKIARHLWNVAERGDVAVRESCQFEAGEHFRIANITINATHIDEDIFPRLQRIAMGEESLPNDELRFTAGQLRTNLGITDEEQDFFVAVNAIK